MKFKPTDAIQELQFFGEFGGKSIHFRCFYLHIYVGKNNVRHFRRKCRWLLFIFTSFTPSNIYLGEALAAMEGTETANVSASGMGSITPVLLQLVGVENTLFLVELFMGEPMRS